MATEAKIVVTAEDRASQVLGGIRSQVDNSVAAFGKLGGALGALGVGAAVAGFRQLIGELDDLSEAAQGVGVSAVALAELRQAAAFSGVEAGKLDKALSGLATRLEDAAKGGEESASIFRTLGVSIKNQDGTLRSTDKVLADLADRFKDYRDGTEKTALANQIFGEKLGRVLIPYLNQGSDSLRQFAGVSEKSVADAEKLQAQIDKLSASWTRLKFSVGGALASLFNEDTKSAEALRKQLADLDVQIQRAGRRRAGERDTERIAAWDVALEGLEDQARRTREALAALDNQRPDERAPAPIIAKAATRDGKPRAEQITDDQRALAGFVDTQLRELDTLREITAEQRVLNLLRANPSIDTAQVREMLDFLQREVEAARATRDYREQIKRINAEQLATEKQLRDTIFDMAGVTEEKRKRLLTEQLEIMIKQGEITEKQAERAVKAIAGWTDEIDKAKSAVDELALVFTSSLGKLIEGGGGGFKGFFEALAQDVLKLTTRMLVLEPIAARIKELLKGSGGSSGSLTDIFGSIFGSAFGGARAMGGPVSAGRSYLVGERGPELFVPGASGSIVPSGSMAPSITINLPAGASVDRGTASQVAAAVARQLSIAQRRYT